MISAFIVDDENLARDELKYLLSDFSGVEVVDESDNIDSAEQKIISLNPDIVFLDINMPGGDGFELLERLTFTPNVVFTTAYDQYALKAFEVNALDYLVKPIDPKRLANVIARIREQIDQEQMVQEKTVQEKIVQEKIVQDQVGKEPSEALGANSKVFVKDRDNCWLVRIGDIELFESVGNYCKVHFSGNQPMLKRSMNYLESRLPPESFIRVNRHCIVNQEAIRDIRPIEQGMLELELSNGKVVEMSRRKAREFKQMKTL